MGPRMHGRVALVAGAASGIGRVTARLFAREGARVIVATDANIRGAQETVTLINSEDREIGVRVTVVGGGLVGCEIGLHLVQKGRKLTIVEMLDDVAREANIMHRRALMLELEKSVEIRTRTECTAITDQGVMTADRHGERVAIACDTVVIAAGYRARSGVVDALIDTALEFSAVGDCHKPKNLLQAVRTGYDAVMAI